MGRKHFQIRSSYSVFLGSFRWNLMVTFLVEQMKFSTLNDSIARKQFVKIAGILS